VRVSDLKSRLETYVLEAYMPRTSAGGPAAAAARANRAAAEMRRNGSPVRLLLLFFLPEDELWFCLYEARSLEEVVEAGRLAELRVGRIQRAIALEPTPHDNRTKASRMSRTKSGY
jgi:hypothetical protein